MDTTDGEGRVGRAGGRLRTCPPGHPRIACGPWLYILYRSYVRCTVPGGCHLRMVVACAPVGVRTLVGLVACHGVQVVCIYNLDTKAKKKLLLM